MSNTEYSRIKFGGLITPLTASTANEILQDADPSIFYMCDFLKAMINTHLGTRLAAQALKAGIQGFASAVGEVVPMDPAPFLTQNQFKFPLLAIYRTQDVETEHSRFHVVSDCQVTVQYIMPPIVAGHMRIVGPILSAVRSVMLARIEQGQDPTYTPPGGALGDSAWNASGLMAIGLQSSKFGGYSDGEKLYFPTWTGTVLLREQTEFLSSDYDTFAGSDLHENLVDPATHTTVNDVVVIATDHSA